MVTEARVCVLVNFVPSDLVQASTGAGFASMFYSDFRMRALSAGRWGAK